MSSSDDSEKTEQPTGRRLQKAREEGQVPRSSEMPAAGVTIAATAVLVGLGGWLVHRLSVVFANGFRFDRKTLDSPSLLPSTFGSQMSEGLFLILPVLAATAVAAIAASGVTRSFHLSWNAFLPKFN